MVIDCIIEHSMAVKHIIDHLYSAIPSSINSIIDSFLNILMLVPFHSFTVVIVQSKEQVIVILQLLLMRLGHVSSTISFFKGFLPLDRGMQLHSYE
jgi:hypothetical protein